MNLDTQTQTLFSKLGQLTKPWCVTTALLFSAASFAAVPVAESSGEPGLNAKPQGSQQAAQQGNSDLLTEMYLQLQQLQAEVDELKGTVELQQFKIDQLNEKRLQDFINLDKRIAAIATGKPSTQALNIAGQEQGDAKQPSNQVSGQELERYKAAQALARGGDLAAATTEFESFVKNYPDSRYLPSALYWLADAALQQKQTEQAQSTWQRLIEQYPTHHKVPAAQYKLAQIEFEQGKKAEAKQRLEAVIANPASQKGVVALAKAYLKRQFP